jgi:hypothetical protein
MPLDSRQTCFHSLVVCVVHSSERDKMMKAGFEAVMVFVRSLMGPRMIINKRRR